MKFQTKLVIGTAAALLGASSAHFLFFSSLVHGLAAGRIEEKALALAQNLASNSSHAVYYDDLHERLGPLLKGLPDMPDVVSVSVRDASGRPLASAGADIPAAFMAGWSDDGRRNLFAATVQVSSPVPGPAPGNKPIGSVRAVLSFERFGAGIRSILVRGIAFAVLVIAAGLGLVAFFANRLTRPMRRILEADEAVVRGDAGNSDIPADEIPADEMGRIIRSRSSMLSALRRLEEEQRSLAGKEQARAAELEKAYLELKALRERLTQAEKLSVLGQVLSGVAHEINNPLTGIMGFSELLLREKFVQERPQLREDLASILREAVRCQKVVIGLTGFARKHKPEKTYISVNELLEQSLKLEAPQLRTRNISVHCELAPGLPGTMADYHQLQQVFMNLIINAEQAMTEQKGCGKLRVRTRLEDSRIRAEVEDDGPGIPPENLARVFDPFFTTKAPGKGTGLGLSLSYGIVSEHCGSISVESRHGKGALFVVELPVMEEVLADGGGEHLSAPLPGGLKILVVDDEVLIRDVFTRILRSIGCIPDTAAKGAEAIEKLKGNYYDAVYCDIRMPEMGGRELYAWVCANKPEYISRWVFMTGSISSESLAFSEGSGRPCLRKPFSQNLVLRSLREVLRCRREDELTGRLKKLDSK